jgi:hypothetical protein
MANIRMTFEHCGTTEDEPSISFAQDWVAAAIVHIAASTIIREAIRLLSVAVLDGTHISLGTDEAGLEVMVAVVEAFRLGVASSKTFHDNISTTRAWQVCEVVRSTSRTRHWK